MRRTSFRNYYQVQKLTTRRTCQPVAPECQLKEKATDSSDCTLIKAPLHTNLTAEAGAVMCKEAHRVRVQTRVRFQRRGPTSPIGFGPKSPSPRKSPIGFGPKSPSPRKSPICFGPKSPSPRKSPIGFGPRSPSPRKSPIWQAIYSD
jgi:hypothetical protein